MPHGLQIVSSNRLEALAERLAAAVVTPRSGDPLAPEWIVVQSRGMARWVQLEIARRAGICALTTFSFPRDFLRAIGRLVVPEAVQDPRFERDALTWRLWDSLDRLRDDPAFAETTRYSASDPRRQFEIASRIAAAFDQYLVYRPELIAAWDEGKDSDWQATLWRTVSGGGPAWHEARRLQATSEQLRTATPRNLPERISWFAIAALPPAYLDVLSALARHSEVTLYTLQPSDHYWGDLLPRRAAARLDPESIPAPEGPRLLVSLGRLGRSFQRQLAEHGAGGGGDPFEDPGDNSLLRAVQSDLLHLRRPQPGDGLAAPSRADPSLRIHSCHSPRRELEVLHDQILDAMDRDPTLGPGDVLVLTPDIETYAPQIHAVFGSPEDERLRLPYTVADRVPRAESRIADAFLRLLRLPEGRCGRSDIEPLLESPVIQRRFGWTPALVSLLQERLETLGIRWGLDASHRARLGLPAFPQGTWRQGTDRLLLGMAMAGGDEALIHGVSPAPDVEGDAVDAAAGLASFLGAAQRLLAWQQQERRLSEWPALLEQTFAAFLDPGPEEQDEALWLREGITRLGNACRDAASDPQVPLAVIRAQLESWLSEERSVGGFLRGGITFAALKPLRSIPARFLAVLGLNDTAFPRRPVPVEFDRIAAEPREGDEAREADDRHLFLETLLSARDRLHLSYVGQSPRDNAPLPPSVVVSELLDHLADRAAGGAAEVAAAVLVRHPLHEFSRDYFGARPDPRLFSFSAENARAAQAAAGGPAAPEVPFLTKPLPARADSVEGVTLDLLARFLRNPSRHFLEQRLGLRLPEEDTPREDRESFAMAGLERFRARRSWLDRLKSGGTPEALRERQLADGELPQGPAGPIAAREMEADVRRLLRALPAEARDDLPPVPVNLHLGAVRLHGTVQGLTPWGLLHIKPAGLKPSDLLDLWLRLIVLAAQDPDHAQRTAHLIVRDDDDQVGLYHLIAPQQPDKILGVLLDLLAQGDRRPLPFFPISAAEFTRPVDSKTKKSPLIRALEKWSGNENSPGESADPAVALCFGRIQPHPLDPEFETLARQVFQPLWSHCEKESA